MSQNMTRYGSLSDKSRVSWIKQDQIHLEQVLHDFCGDRGIFKVNIAYYDGGMMGNMLKITIEQTELSRFMLKKTLTLAVSPSDYSSITNIVLAEAKKFKRGRTKLWKRNPLKDF